MITIQEIFSPKNKIWEFDFGLADNVYAYGSRVYGTHKQHSDRDFIVVANISENKIDEKDNVTLYNHLGFQQAIDEHEISVLECIFLPSKLVMKKTVGFDFNLDLSKLRHSISKKASNSWVKCKKKLTVPEDFDAYIAKKSLFHSLRIISFGKQIAAWGRIRYYNSMNHLYDDIIYHPSCDWNFYKEKYRPLYNQMMTEFRKLAPK